MILNIRVLIATLCFLLLPSLSSAYSFVLADACNPMGMDIPWVPVSAATGESDPSLPATSCSLERYYVNTDTVYDGETLTYCDLTRPFSALVRNETDWSLSGTGRCYGSSGTEANALIYTRVSGNEKPDTDVFMTYNTLTYKKALSLPYVTYEGEYWTITFHWSKANQEFNVSSLRRTKVRSPVVGGPAAYDGNAIYIPQVFDLDPESGNAVYGNLVLREVGANQGKFKIESWQ